MRIGQDRHNGDVTERVCRDVEDERQLKKKKKENRAKMFSLNSSSTWTNIELRDQKKEKKFSEKMTATRVRRDALHSTVR